MQDACISMSYIIACIWKVQFTLCAKLLCKWKFVLVCTNITLKINLSILIFLFLEQKNIFCYHVQLVFNQIFYFSNNYSLMQNRQNLCIFKCAKLLCISLLMQHCERKEVLRRFVMMNCTQDDCITANLDFAEQLFEPQKPHHVRP